MAMFIESKKAYAEACFPWDRGCFRLFGFRVTYGAAGIATISIGIGLFTFTVVRKHQRRQQLLEPHASLR